MSSFLDSPFYHHIRKTIGWTEFAKRHTSTSGKEYETAFNAGLTYRDADIETAVTSVINLYAETYKTEFSFNGINVKYDLQQNIGPQIIEEIKKKGVAWE